MWSKLKENVDLYFLIGIFLGVRVCVHDVYLQVCVCVCVCVCVSPYECTLILAHKSIHSLNDFFIDKSISGQQRDYSFLPSICRGVRWFPPICSKKERESNKYPPARWHMLRSVPRYSLALWLVKSRNAPGTRPEYANRWLNGPCKSWGYR